MIHAMILAGEYFDWIINVVDFGIPVKQIQGNVAELWGVATVRGLDY